MVVWLIILAMLILFIVFCSGYVFAEASAYAIDEYEEVPFFKKWNQYVEDSQAGKVGPILMKTLYLIPTTVAFVSWCRFKVQPALEKDLD